MFSKFGEDAQKRLLKSRVAVIGCGGLGTNVVNMLARAGVGFIRVVDKDVAELNNLQRQTLFDENDVREKLPKAVAAKRKIKDINSGVTVEAVVTEVTPSNAGDLVSGVDLALDGTDNFETRFVINQACVRLKQPWIYAACIESRGLVMPIIPYETPCLACVFEGAPPKGLVPKCDSVGVLAPIVMMTASFEVTEAFKFLTGRRDEMHRGLFSFDIWTREIKTFDWTGLLKKGGCPVCR